MWKGIISQSVQSDAEAKAAAQAVIAQNLALASIRVSEQLQQPLASSVAQSQPNSTPQSSQPSSPGVLPDEGKDELVTPDPIQNTQLGQTSNLGDIDSKSTPSVLVPLGTNSPQVVEHEEIKDESLIPNPIKGTPERS